MPWPKSNSSALLLRTFNGLRDELISTLLFVLGNREDAQDAAQEAFVKCWGVATRWLRCRTCGRGSFASVSTPPRICSAAPGIAGSNLYVGRNSWSPATNLPPGNNSNTANRSNNSAGRSSACREEEKEVFLLRQNGELTYEQIAEMRHLPVGTVKTQMRSAIRQAPQVVGVNFSPRPAGERGWG